MKPWRITFNVSGQFLVYPPTSEPAVAASITFTTEKEAHMDEITVKADETTLKADVTFTDSKGNVTLPDGVPTWEVADPAVLTVTPAADGMTATFAVLAPGVSAVTVKGVETHGGVGEPTEITGTGTVTVEAGEAVTAAISFSVG
jgi:hypothetical protein